tara:strand:+ start:117 stop:983 length:867 start_codon:yes stop_codon:yes gene_type:complete
MNVDIIDARIDKLLVKRGICGHTAAIRFVEDFKAYFCYYAMKTGGDMSHTLKLLENDENLISRDVFYTNFRRTFDDLIPKMFEDTIFPLLFDTLVKNKGKGVGVGELVFPLIISGYTFSNESDGKWVEDGGKVEVKKNGASLKTVETGLTDKGLVDRLNNDYFRGTVPGMKNKKKFNTHIATVTNPKVYADYFEELYVGCDTTELAKEVLTCYTDPMKFNNAVGQFALKNYKRIDGWSNIIIIDNEKRNFVNITDVENIGDLGLKFIPKFKRGRDTQAVPDGYVNVGI